MPKVGMEPIRRKALIAATIREVGAKGSLDVTVSTIAKRAGVSSGLAHHYFGGKDQIFLAAMREILTRYSRGVQTALKSSDTPMGRLEALICANFHKSNFKADVIAAWLSFYVLAQTDVQAQRLLRIYARRLQSNLLFDLRKLAPEQKAADIANGMASMIDGFYVREALQSSNADGLEAVRVVTQYLHLQLADD